jgi:hypothetical protein
MVDFTYYYPFIYSSLFSITLDAKIAQRVLVGFTGVLIEVNQKRRDKNVQERIGSTGWVTFG